MGKNNEILSTVLTYGIDDLQAMWKKGWETLARFAGNFGLSIDKAIIDSVYFRTFYSGLSRWS